MTKDRMSSGRPNFIREWRRLRNLSLNKLSAKLAYNGQYASPNTLNRWEKGETPLPEWAIPELAKALRITEEDFLSGPHSIDSSMPVNTSAAFTGLDLEIAEQVINMGFTSWIASQPIEARRAAESIIPWLETAQRRAPLSIHVHQGKHLLARGYELLGVLALDQLENDAAIAQFRRALAVSEELSDINLIVAHMTELGDAYRRRDDKEMALMLMGAALERTGEATRATRGYVLEMIAYTFADTGDEKAFHRHIEEATDLLSHSGEGEGAGKRDFIPFEVLEIYGKSMRDFGHPIQALGYLDKAEEALASRPNVPRWHAVLTISRAQALCDAGELEEGVKLAIKGISLAHSCQSPRQMNRVRKLKKKLEESEYRDAPALNLLHDVVNDTYSSNRSPLDWRPQHAM